MHPSYFLVTSTVLLSSLCAARPWPENSGDHAKTPQLSVADLFRRQDNADSTPTAEESSPTDEDGSNSSDGDDDNEENNNSDDEGNNSDEEDNSDDDDDADEEEDNDADATDKSTKDANTKTKSSSTTKTIDPRLGPGGVHMITPSVFDAQQYYKIGDYVTFVWNYTSLLVSPSAIDVLASCSANQETYTIAANQSFQETATVIWDTNEFQESATIPLLTASYTLIIYDVERGISAAAQAGYLAPAKTLTFGMYEPQEYVPLSDFDCPTCSGALSIFEHRTLSFVFAMCIITLTSFAWFASVFGVL